MRHLKGIASIIIAVIFAASSVCAVQTVQVSAASKPAKVKSLTLSLDQANKQVKLSWKKARGAKKYQVYIKAPAAKWKKLQTVKATRATYQAAKAGTYYFKVRGVKSSKKGKFSAVKYITLSSALWKTGTASKPTQPTQSTKPSSGTPSNPGSSGSNPGGNSGSTTNPTNPGTNPGSTVLITRIGLQGNSSIYPGDSTTITASPYPTNATNKSVRWQVASYSGVTWSQNGNSVTIKTSKSTPAGSLKVTASAKDGSGVTASTNITINVNPIRGLHLINLHPVYDDSLRGRRSIACSS